MSRRDYKLRQVCYKLRQVVIIIRAGYYKHGKTYYILRIFYYKLRTFWSYYKLELLELLDIRSYWLDEIIQTAAKKEAPQLRKIDGDMNKLN